MGETCGSCGPWVDDIFWNHFKFIHFAQRLPSGFDQRLAIPKRFSDNLRRKLPDNVTLRGPGGAFWSVRLMTIENTLYFMQGWQLFAKDHCLKENDLLVFKYNGESQFDVLIFDRESFCESAAAYFVGKSEPTDKRNRDNSLEEVNIPFNTGVEFASPKKSVRGNSKKNRNAAVECASPEQTKRKARPVRSNARARQVKPVRSSARGQEVKPVRSNARGGEDNLIHVLDAEPSASGNMTYEILYASNGMSDTENKKEHEHALQLAQEINKEHAVELAQAACTDDGFYVVMRPSHINKFYMKIPVKWMAERFPRHSEDVILRMEQTEWLAKYNVERGGRAAGLSGGWRHFVLDNKLQEFDVCVFKPPGKISTPLIIEVQIFRVNE
ncbi:B3 domain-containing protein REM16-like [Senna tora]|uniref:B3 domain-containing protein REM16-like n=1 Tax=Senna tora TaxID=362788 RepID=A0A834TTP7_9FABA|nr:B3 domain-containing protein REM16-like [Senna tora]